MVTLIIHRDNRPMSKTTDYPTVALIFACYAVWGILLLWAPVWLVLLLLGPVITLHASLQHEVLHGHPFANQQLNAALVWPSLNLCVPYARFRDTHLAHHNDPMLTDPYEDPETNYLDPEVWCRKSRLMQGLLQWNNTLFGRLLIGPVIGQIGFMITEIRNGTRDTMLQWSAHLVAVMIIAGIVLASPTSLWTYGFGVYVGLCILKLRTFLEHQAATKCRARTAIVESSGIFGLLFLNNNLHVVHHAHPSVAWHRLPMVYAANRQEYLRRNEGYHYTSYWQVFRRYAWRSKDPVAHPLWQKP